MVARLPGKSPGVRDSENRGQLLYDRLKRQLDNSEFSDWFECGSCEFFAPDRFVFTTANSFRGAWIEQKYGSIVREAARELFDFDPRIEFLSDQLRERSPTLGALDVDTRRRQDVRDFNGQESISSKTISSKEHADDERDGVDRKDAARIGAIRETLTFDSFVEAPGNRMALAASRAACEGLNESSNPLFLYGDHGTGKTHLLAAVCNELLHHRGCRVIHQSSEDFTNSLLAAIQTGSVESFRARYLASDGFVLEDLQFLYKKKRTQEELGLLIAALIDAGKRVLLSCIDSPYNKSKLEDRLRSCVQSGLVAEIKSPDAVLRTAVLMRKALFRGHELPADVASFVASRVGENLRDVEGALARLLMFASMLNMPPSLEVAQVAFGEVRVETPTVSISSILQIIQEHFDLKVRDLLSRSKVRSVVYARQVGMVLARELTPLSLVEIGMHFGGRDHTTVLYALRKIRKLRDQRADVHSTVLALKARAIEAARR